MSRTFEVVVAKDRARGIGKAGTLPWHLPADLAHFRALTTRKGASEQPNTVIMGRLTWESLPVRFRPLARRRNVVVTRTPIDHVGVSSVSSLDAALASCPSGAGCFVIGGSGLFRAAFQHPGLDAIHLTELDANFDCDVFLPDLPEGLLREEAPWQQDGGIVYRFVTLRRPG